MDSLQRYALLPYLNQEIGLADIRRIDPNALKPGIIIKYSGFRGLDVRINVKGVPVITVGLKKDDGIRNMLTFHYLLHPHGEKIGNAVSALPDPGRVKRVVLLRQEIIPVLNGLGLEPGGIVSCIKRDQNEEKGDNGQYQTLHDS